MNFRHWLYHIFKLTLGILLVLDTPLFARAHNGILDLEEWNFDKEPQVRLSGEWEFYWTELYEHADLAAKKPKADIIAVPGLWNFVKDYPKRGYATYRLHVKLREARTLAIRMPWVLSASKLFIDDQFIEEAGQVARNDDPRVYRPVLHEDYWTFTPASAEFDIIVQVTSFNIHLPGMPNTPTLGTVESIKRSFQRDVGLALFLVGCLFIMAIYHFCLFALRTKTPSTLYFAFLCLFIALYMIAASSATMGTFFPHLSYPDSMRFFMVWMMAVPFFAYYSHEMYPELFSKRVAHFLLIMGPGIYAGSFFTEVKDTEIPFITFNLVTGLYALYVLVRAIKAFREKRDGAGIFLSATAVLFATAIHDSIRLFFESIALGGFGLFAFIVGQSLLLARRFSQAFDRIDRLNENLEEIVSEKTREIRSILEQIPLGIFLITREGRKIHKDYSQHLLQLFEVQDLTGRDGLQLLLERSDLEPDQKSQMESVLDAILGEDPLGFALNQATLPRDMVVTRRDGTSMILELGWSPIVDPAGKVEQLLVTLRDMTELRSLELEARGKKEELLLIQELINVPAPIYHRFSSSCRDFLNENRRLINTVHDLDKDWEVLKILFINLHTMKGAARSLYFKKMTQVFHSVEQYYASLQKNPDAPWDLGKMNRDLDDAERILDIYDSIHSEKLGRRPSEDKGGSIGHHQARQIHGALEKARQLLRGSGPYEAQALLDGAIAALFSQLYRPLDEVLRSITKGTATLARDLGKHQPDVLINAAGFHVTTHTEELLHKIFIHVLRNSMDHGLEGPEERRHAHKDPAGLLRMDVSMDGKFVCIAYEDDGRGLDVDRIRRIAVKNGLIAPDSARTASEAAELIFLSGLSTSRDTTDISGRGMGMDAIRNFARQAGGDVRIQLLDPKGPEGHLHPFTLEILLPAALFMRIRWDLDAA
ncbi:MAG TPA: 7TM diverse intracellular signaling domain-containing protein [Oligoflexus sp.]|uniref:7TM diverse intracellular signaling domain-containing protein n=1 Tax=Oligoflexus sp. TaxID=1971216 RepID=UPI002D81069B|nr:7TM diverse intracellular signaling domain-containing protein [Oligoflexus sp.]HET9238452.1 7TM diverse intracellular signaling domain-containing protein [Oligoflexus sp.]